MRNKQPVMTMGWVCSAIKEGVALKNCANDKQTNKQTLNKVISNQKGQIIIYTFTNSKIKNW